MKNVINAEGRILELRSEVRKHDELYDMNRPILSDEEYNNLYYELVDLEKAHPQFDDPTSPTRKIYTKMVEELTKVKHSFYMGSQEKIKTWDGVLKFVSRFQSRVLAQFKLDGLTVVLTYEGGVLTAAVTRGDGEVGENILHTVRTIRNLPLSIPYKGKLELRMESIIPYEDFERILETADYSNPRNLVSGSLRQLNAKIAEERQVSGIVFELISIEDKTFTCISDQLAFLADQGFTVVDSRSFENTPEGLDALKAYINQVETKLRPSLPYMIDGLVIKFDDLAAKNELGNTDKHPRWSSAFKFASLEATTKLLGIEESVGRTGQITPVALLELVDIGGVNVARASLANYGDLTRRDIRIGDTVVAIRANDVIPKLTTSIKELRTGNEIVVEPPKQCPSCGAPTEFRGAHLFCTSTACTSQIKGLLTHFGSRSALNIVSLGEKTVEDFVDLGLATSIPELYALESKKEELLKLENFGEKSFKKLITELEKAKSAPLHKVLYALSIRLLGESKAKDLTRVYKDMDSLLEASLELESFKETLLGISDFGQAIAESLSSFFSSDANRSVIAALQEVGFAMKSEFTEPTGDLPLSGKSVVVTGTLEAMTREEAEAKLESLGAKPSGSVSKKTAFVVAGDKAGSKRQKAIDLGVQIFDEAAFLAYLKTLAS